MYVCIAQLSTDMTQGQWKLKVRKYGLWHDEIMLLAPMICVLKCIPERIFNSNKIKIACKGEWHVAKEK